MIQLLIIYRQKERKFENVGALQMHLNWVVPPHNTAHSRMGHCSVIFSPFGATTSGGSRISRCGGRRPVGGRQPLTRTLFSENVCENERN